MKPPSKEGRKRGREEGKKRQAGKLNRTGQYIFLCKKAELWKWKFIFPFP